jgi:hypothetical protein
MSHPSEMHVIDLSRSLGERGHQRRMPVAVLDRPPRGNAVDHAATVRERQKFVARSNHRERIVGIA